MTETLLPLQRMQGVSWTVLAILVAGSFVFATPNFGISVLLGGLVSIGSYWVSHRDIVRLVDSISALNMPEDRQAQARQGQRGYLVKFWIRLVIIGVVLLLIIKSGRFNVLGLILGLSTVVLAVTLVALDTARHYVFRGRR